MRYLTFALAKGRLAKKTMGYLEQIGTLATLAPKIGDDVFLERVCEVLDLDYEDIKAKIKQNAPIDLNQASEDLMNIEEQNEQMAQANGTDIA